MIRVFVVLVAKSYLTLLQPLGLEPISPPVNVIIQAIILAGVAISFSKASS